MTPTRRQWIAGAAAAIAPVPAARDVRVMTFNIRVPVDEEPARRWSARLPVVVAMLRRTAPDVIGLQELMRRQAQDVIAALPRYAWFGHDRDDGRDGGRDGEHMGIMYRRQSLTLLEQGDFWFSDTPAVPGSMGWGNIYPRMTTWGLFRRRDTGTRLYVLNTHFPYRPEDASIRDRCAAALLAHIAKLPADVPVVLTGDFNADPREPVHGRLTATLADAREAAGRVTGPAATFHDFGGRPDRRLDWILTRRLKARTCETVTDRHGEVWPSDHFPVLATFGT